MDQKEKRQQERKTEKGKGRGRREKSVMFACLEEEETDQWNEEIPENGVNVAYRHINLENVSAGQ